MAESPAAQLGGLYHPLGHHRPGCICTSRPEPSYTRSGVIHHPPTPRIISPLGFPRFFKPLAQSSAARIEELFLPAQLPNADMHCLTLPEKEKKKKKKGLDVTPPFRIPIPDGVGDAKKNQCLSKPKRNVATCSLRAVHLSSSNTAPSIPKLPHHLSSLPFTTLAPLIYHVTQTALLSQVRRAIHDKSIVGKHHLRWIHNSRANQTSGYLSGDPRIGLRSQESQAVLSARTPRSTRAPPRKFDAPKTT